MNTDGLSKACGHGGNYRALERKERPMRYLGEQEVEDIAMGAAVMASGGGGNPYVGILIAKQCVADNGPIPLLTLDELPDDARVAVSMGLGAPTVLVEKVPAGP